MCNKICGRMCSIIFIIAALALAIFISSHGGRLGATHHDRIIFIVRIFDILIPVLATGALVKYLLCGGGKSKDSSCCSESSCCSSNCEEEEQDHCCNK